MSLDNPFGGARGTGGKERRCVAGGNAGITFKRDVRVRGPVAAPDVLLGLSTPTFVRSVDEFLVRTELDGWDFAEFNHLDIPPFCPELLDKEARRRARAMAGDLGIGISLHAGDWDLLSLDPGVRRYAEVRSLMESELARDLGALYLVSHIGIPQRMMLHDGGRAWADQFFDYAPRVEAAVEHLSRVADETGVRILYENTYRLVGPLVEAIAARGSPRLGFLLDVGHANVGEGVRELHRAMRATGRLVAMHLHDNHGARDEHLPLGAGTVDLDGLELPPYVVVEVRDWQKAVATRDGFSKRYL